MFSSRVPGQLEPNRLTRALRGARAKGQPLLDLTVTNPTIVDIEYPPGLLDPLAHARALTYEPSPFGLAGARAAVAHDYARRGIAVATEHVVLTASTSEAYSLLFKLLCEPDGDAVLAPVPSYPLFDHLMRLDGVSPVPYRLEYHGRWTVDVGSVDGAWLETVRAIVAVSPNNPTGSILTADERDALGARCAERRAALILDEVFADYPLHDGTLTAGSHRESAADRCLTFRLGGLSKSAGLPQLKLGWIAVSGPPDLRDGAIERLEMISDTYLSVATPVQVAAPALLASAGAVRDAITARIRTNYAELRTSAAANPAVQVLNAEAGWSAVIRIPATAPEEDFVVNLLQRDGVIVHPGFFFDFPAEAFLVVSLLPKPPCFAEGVRRIVERARG